MANAGTIAVSDNSWLQLTGGGTYTNDGSIMLNATNSTSSSLVLHGGGTVTLGGTGALTMTGPFGSRIFADSAGMTLVNAAGHQITGAGTFGFMGGEPFTFQNEGTVTAAGGMGFAPGVTVLNAGGTIRADGSDVVFLWTAGVLGGTLDVSNGGGMTFDRTFVQNADLKVAPGAVRRADKSQ